MDHPPVEVIPEPEITLRPRTITPDTEIHTRRGLNTPAPVDYFHREKKRQEFQVWMERVGPLELPAYVYFLIDAEDRILYIGSTYNIKTRLQTHWKNQEWIEEVARVKWEMYPSRAEAYEVEDREIKELQPLKNKYGAGSKQPRRKNA